MNFADLEHKQMLERELEVVKRVSSITGDNEVLMKILKRDAFDALREAEKKMHAYAVELEIGPERTQAFEWFENIRTATRT